MDKHEIIFNYWKDKCITSKGTVETMDKYDFSNSSFTEIFNKYDQNDLIDKLRKNVAIVEYL